MNGWAIAGVLVLSGAAWLPSDSAKPVALVPATEASSAVPDVEIPWTRDKIFWRKEFAGRRGPRAERVKGRLTLDASTLRIDSRKESFEIPLEQIELVFPTALGGDVDLDWVAVQVSERIAGRPRVYGIRDGRKLGFGRATSTIADALIARVQALEVAQFRREPGYVPYTALDERMVFLVPDTWRVAVLNEVYRDGRLTSGRTRFLPADREDVSLEMAVEKSTRGYRCDRFPVDRIKTAGGAVAESVSIAHCSAVRISSPPAQAGESTTRWQVANGDSLFELTLRAPADERSRWLEIAEKVISSWRLAAQP